MTSERPIVDVDPPVGGWPPPWRNVAEVASVLPHDKWTLVGGLMTQLHTISHRIGVVRATNDIDIVLHIETSRGVPGQTVQALEGIGYRLLDSFDPRDNTAHRFVRGASVIDVLIADHPAPRVIETLRGRDMVRIDGGTQALKRTMDARMEIDPGVVTTVSVPSPFGALILKAAAYIADARDRERHLYDAAALLACIDDPFVDRAAIAGSDRLRLTRLVGALPNDYPAWRALDEIPRSRAEAALRILTSRT